VKQCLRTEARETMSSKSYDLHGVRVFECAPGGPVLRNDQDAIAVIGEAMAHRARLIVIPAARLAPDFFRLQTRLAGEMLQKFVNYRLRLAIIGDLSGLASNSTALRAFIDESNRGDAIWFLANLGDVEKRLAPQESNQS
jgi:hypothetical protein